MKRLYCIPGGGTTSILFIQWQKKLGPDIKVEYLDIPGRGYLSKKPEQQDMNGIAEVLAAEIMAKSADEPYLIWDFYIFRDKSDRSFKKSGRRNDKDMDGQRGSREVQRKRTPF